MVHEVWQFLTQMAMSLEEKPDTAQMEDVLFLLALKTVRRIGSFTAMNVTNKCVNNAERNTRRIQIQKKKKTRSGSLQSTKPQLSVKKCKLHPTRKIEINLKDSNLPLCLKCVVKKGHLVIHLRTLKIYMLTKLNVVRQKFRKSKKIGQPPTT